MGGMTNYLANEFLDHLDGNAYSAPGAIYLGLTTTPPVPDGTWTEVSGGGYARQAVTFRPADGSGEALLSTAVSSWTVNGSNDVTVSGLVIFDAATSGNGLFYATTSSPFLVRTGTSVTFAAEAIRISMAGAASIYTAQKWLDLVLSGTAWSAPSGLWLGETTDVATSGGSFTEVSGGGYARQQLDFPVAASRTYANGSAESFAPLDSAEANALLGWVVADQSNGGSMLLYAAQYPASPTTAVSVPASDNLAYSAGDITVTA